MRNDSHIVYAPLKPEHACQVAKLHKEGIATGFLSSLGEDFLADLYQAISQSPDGFGFVVQIDNKVEGFVSFCTNLKKLYKQIYRKKGLKFLLVLAPKLFSIQTVRKIIQTMFYPQKTKKLNLPDAELLSIVVSSGYQGKALARQLIELGFQECQRRNISSVKVLVAQSNQLANHLYQKTGFRLTTEINSHGIISNVYVASSGYFKEEPSM